MHIPQLSPTQRRFAIGGSLLLLAILIGLFVVELWPPRSEPSDYLTDKARALNFDADRIVSFVRNDIDHEVYDGVLRGPLGTLWAGSGNDLDRVLLLQALLNRAGVRNRLVHGQTYGVEVGDRLGRFRYIGPSRDADPDAKPVAALPDDLYHTVEIQVRTFTSASRRSDEGRTFRTADLIGVDTLLFYRQKGEQGVAVLAVHGQEIETAADASLAQRQEVAFRLGGPGVNAIERRRELFTREFRDFPSLFNPDNRYAFVITAGWIPDSARTREVEKAGAWTNKTDALNHVVAYTFLARSDTNTREMMAAKQMVARIVEPRITIVSSEIEANADQPMRSLSLDLRKNDVQIDGPEERRVAFAMVRSLYDASLEAAVLSELTCQQAISAVDLIADAFARRQAMLAERQHLVRRSLERLLVEGRDGASLSVAPEGKDVHTIRFERKEGSELQVVLSDAVKRGLAAAQEHDFCHKVHDLGILTAPLIGRGDLDTVSRETEVALACSAELPMAYTQTFEYAEAPPPQWYANSRIFTFSGPNRELNFERQFLALEPDVRVNTVDYFNNIDQSFYSMPKRGTTTITKNDLEHAKTYTHWYYESSGRTAGMLSREAYAELQRHGTTTLRHRSYPDKDSELLQLWLIGRKKWPATINQRRVDIPVLELAGDFEKNRMAKPEKVSDVPDITDASHVVINKITILDDPHYPIWITEADVIQSMIPGRIVDTVSGRGVPDARIKVRGPDVSATTWPDGRFVLPIIMQPFREFEISVQAQGYKTLMVKRDFRYADTFPLDFKLEPLPREDAFAWIDQSTLDTTLPGLHLTERGKRLITEALQDNEALAVVVPTFAVYHPYGKIDAWLEIDTTSYEIYGRLDDGLYGSTLRAIVPGASAPQHPAISTIAYFSGHVAAWYAFAAGGIDTLDLVINRPNVTVAEMHRHATKTAHEMAKIDDGFIFKFAISKAPIVGMRVVDKSFRKGLKDGLAWAEEFYKHAWGL